MKRISVLSALAVLLISTATASADIRVSTTDALKGAVTRPAPAYSPMARQMKVSGHVEVEAVVATDGSVESVRPVTGNPLLTQSVVQAVQKMEVHAVYCQWRSHTSRRDSRFRLQAVNEEEPHRDEQLDYW